MQDDNNLRLHYITIASDMSDSTEIKIDSVRLCSYVWYQISRKINWVTYHLNISS